MKKLVLIIAAALAPFTFPNGGKVSKKEKAFAIKYMESSMKDIFKSIKGLSAEQWNYKASESSWSVAGTCEHLFIAEQAIGQNVKNNIIKNESFRLTIPESEKITDKQVIEKISDRTPANRVKTAPAFEPKGMFSSPKEFIAKYKEARKQNIEFLKNTEDELKAYYFESPVGKISAYQWLLLLSAHAERHHRQMKEVISATNFPNK